MSFLRNAVILITISQSLFTLAADNLASPIPHKDCPLIDDVKHAIMLPYPHDCSKYYNCLKGYAYLQQCPNNLQWSTLTYRCDYPEVAKCQTAVDTTNVAYTTTTHNTEETIYQLYPLDCTKYYKCQAMSCPRNYYWNSLMQRCDFPHLTYCPYNAPVQQQFIQAKQIFNIEMPYKTAEVTYQTYPNDCGKFYQCQLVNCPLNYHWNSLQQQCTLPQLALCPYTSDVPFVTETSSPLLVTPVTAFTAPPTPAANVPSTTVPGLCNNCSQLCEDSLHQYRPYPNDCHKFVQCNGLAFIHTCPDNLFWNAKLNTCDRYCVLN